MTSGWNSFFFGLSSSSCVLVSAQRFGQLLLRPSSRNDVILKVVSSDKYVWLAHMPIASSRDERARFPARLKLTQGRSGRGDPPPPARTRIE